MAIAHAPWYNSILQFCISQYLQRIVSSHNTFTALSRQFNFFIAIQASTNFIFHIIKLCVAKPLSNQRYYIYEKHSSAKPLAQGAV